MLEGWQAFNRYCSVRIGSQTFKLPVSTVTIRAIPRLDGGSPVVVDISGRRRSNFKTRQYWTDAELTWQEIGDVDWPAFRSFMSALYIASESTVINFCPKFPYDSNTIIPDVIVEWGDDVAPMMWSDQMRSMPAHLIFRQKNPSSSPVHWMIG